MRNSGQLFIVAVPIGNPKDITLRALETLRLVDAIICEEERAGSTLLKRIGVREKELILLNEHNEQEQTPEIVRLLTQEGCRFALISDCGTPIFADPGHALVQQAANLEIPIIPIPGPSSLTAALSVLDTRVDKFIFAGFLHRERNKRQKELYHLRNSRMPVIIMDTPYRMGVLLDDVIHVFGKRQRITLACDLTLPGEEILRDTAAKVRTRVGKRKAEFVLIIHL